MATDVSGWTTRLDDAMVQRFNASGAWVGATLGEMASRLAQAAPDRTAVVDGPMTVSFGDLFQRAVRLVGALQKRGLQAGEVISFQLPNWHEAMVINLASALGGFVCNPIVPIYRDAEVGFILQHSRTRVLFIPASFRSMDYVEMVQRLKPNLPSLDHVVLVRSAVLPKDHAAYEAWLADGQEAQLPYVDANAVKLLLYTSGTTGEPKGVLHSHNTIRAEIDAVIRFWSIGAQDVVLMPSPVTHITGYLYALELAFVAGIKAVLMERWNAQEAVDLIRAHGASFTIGATPFLVELTGELERRQLGVPSLRLFASGGAPVPHAVVQRARDAMPGCVVFRVYGSSEAPTVSLGVAPGDSVDLGATTDGCIVNHEVQIIDPVTGKRVPVGCEGEIITRGPELMLGYTKAADTTEAFDADGYFHTGDLGFVDERGYLTISGRKKDLIIRGGENISPKEIEEVLHRHPAVLEAAVVAMPHERLGESPCAFVVLRPGGFLDQDAMRTFLEESRIARQKFPERLVVLTEMPRTASGKVLKHVLRQRIAQAAAEL